MRSLRKTTSLASLLFLFLVLLSFQAAQAAAAQIVVIKDTDDDAYSLEQVRLSGDLEQNLLKITGSGEVISGDTVRIYLFGPTEDILVDNIIVNSQTAPVSFDKRGYYFVAEKGRFIFNGILRIRTIGQIKLQVPGPINELNFDLQHGYVVGGDRFGLYDNSVVIQRSEQVAKMAEGKFRFSFAERNEFYYVLSYRAFGSTLGRETVELRNGEQISSVVGALKWEQSGNELILDLMSDTATVSVSGYFTAETLRIPFKEGRHRVVLESDPEKKLSIYTSATEVDVSEGGMPVTYGNARAFLATYYDSFQTSIQDLEVLPSLAASVSRADMTVAITEKGSVLGELSYQYANTGVDYIELNAPGTPLYAAAGYQPVKLTKGDKLMLSLPKTGSSGGGKLALVYFETIRPLRFIDIVTVPLASTELPITQQSTSIYLPGNYIVLETFGAKGGSELPPAKSIIMFLLIFGALAFFVLGSRKFVLSYILFAFGLLLFDTRLLWLLVAASIVLIIKRYVRWKEGKAFIKWMLAGAGIFVLIVIVVFFITAVGESGMMTSSSRGSYEMAADYAMFEENAVAPQFKGMVTLAEGEDGAITVPTRKGVLPVRMEIPNLGKRLSVTSHLVTKENPLSLKLLIVASWLKYVLYIAALLSGGICIKTYRKARLAQAAPLKR